MDTRTGMALAGLMLAWSMAAPGQDCSVPPFAERYASVGSAEWTVDADGCGLDAVLAAGRSAAAVAHYARRPGLGNLRMRFRADLSALTGLDILQSAQLAAGIAGAAQPAGENASARLFQVSVFGSFIGTQANLAVIAACAGQAGNQCLTVSPLSTPAPTIGLDWISGPAGIGQLRWWIDTDFSDAPTGSMAVDNADWGALERVVLGLSSPTPAFAHGQSGRTVRFDRIEVLEDQLAWHDFEDLDGGACVLDTAPPLVIGGGGTQVTGSTCGGTWSLTTLASGSTWAATPERNLRVHITGVGQVQAPRPLAMQMGTGSDPAIAAFLCERACSPSARCHLTSSELGDNGVFPPGDYRLVLKSLGTASGHCGHWTVDISSVLK